MTANTMALKLGKVAGTDFRASISPTSESNSILVTGRSGTEKTTTLGIIENNISRIGGSCLVLNYGATHSNTVSDSHILHWNVCDQGLPFPLFSPFVCPDGSVEDVDDAVEAILNVFNSTRRLYTRQRGVLRDSIENVLYNYSGTKDFGPLVRSLEEMESDAARSILDLYRPIFNKVKFCESGKALLGSGQILILDMDKFASDMQNFVSELMLSILWRYFQLWGQYARAPLFVVCDEFQRLNIGKGSVFSQVLCEGRKFHLSLMLATQSLSVFDKAQTAIIQQTATQLFFCPALRDVRSVARMIDTEDLKNMETKLRGLHKGECIATGHFQVGGREADGPIKLSFWK